MSFDSYGTYSHDLVDFLYLFRGLGFDGKNMFLTRYGPILLEQPGL